MLRSSYPRCMSDLDDVRRAARDLADLRREVAAHEQSLEVAIASAARERRDRRRDLCGRRWRHTGSKQTRSGTDARRTPPLHTFA